MIAGGDVPGNWRYPAMAVIRLTREAAMARRWCVVLGYAGGGRILKVVLTPDEEEIITLAWPDE